MVILMNWAGVSWFWRVEQVDVESYGKFEKGNTASPYITDDKTLYQPPVKTITWYHTGAFLDRERIITHFKHEYFPNWLEEKFPGKVKIQNNFQENELPQPDLESENLNAEEWREALRACKGMMLRQEVYELEINALVNSNNQEQLPVKLFSSAYHNCHIRHLQEKRITTCGIPSCRKWSNNLPLWVDIREEQLAKLSPDPRIAHTLNLQYDEYANVLQSVAVVYSRIGQFVDDSLDSINLKKIHDVQLERHIAYTETRYTDDFGTK